MRINVEKFQLENGLKVLIHEDNSLPLTGYYTFFKVGSRNERPGITGISHLFEHMMFNGSVKFGPGEFDRILESNGGYSNAYTTRDITVYYENIPSRAFEKIVEMDADRMENLNLNEKNLASEREVVKEERRMRTDNSIVGILEEEIYASSYTAHPYRWPVIGWMSDLNAISLQDCYDYYKRFYAPNNAVIIVVGDITAEESMEKIRKYYGHISPGIIKENPLTQEPEQRGEKRIKYFKETDSVSFCIGYKAPSVYQKEIYPLDLIQIMLTHGESSLLHKNLILKKEMATSIFCDFGWKIDPSLFILYIRLKPETDAEKAEEIIYNEIEKIKKGKINKKDFEKAKKIMEAEFIRMFKTFSEKANKLGFYEIILGDHSKLYDSLIQYRTCTRDQIIEAANNYLHEKNRTVVSIYSE